MYTPEETEKVKAGRRKAKKQRPPKKKYLHYFPEHRAVHESSEKDREKVRKMYYGK
jgi:hypothetical protein